MAFFRKQQVFLELDSFKEIQRATDAKGKKMNQLEGRMEGFGSDGKSHQQESLKDLERSYVEEYGSDSDETPLERHINRGKCAKTWFFCFRTSKNLLWTLFVVVTLANMYITSNHIYVDDQISLKDERDIAHLVHQVNELQANQRVLTESILRLAQLHHDPEKQKEIFSIVQTNIKPQACDSNKDDLICKPLQETVE